METLNKGDAPLILIQQINLKWSLEIERFEAPLQRGLRITIDPAAFKPGSPVAPQASDIACRLVDWRYQIKDAERAVLVLLVEEEKPSEPDPTPRTDDRKVFAGMTSGILGVLFFLGIAYTCYVNPEDTWALAGRHVRWAGGWALFAIFSFILPVRLGLNRRVSFLNSFYWSVLNLTGFILIGLWLSLAHLPANFAGTQPEYIAYARALVGKLNASYWPVLLAILPWAAVAFKAFGFERAEKTADALQEAIKKVG